MAATLSLVLSILSFLTAGVLGGADYPPIPKDLTTPVQQRISVDGPNSE